MGSKVSALRRIAVVALGAALLVAMQAMPVLAGGKIP
jgi:hypothetical protein